MKVVAMNKRARGPLVDPHDPLPTARAFLSKTGAEMIHQAGVFYEWEGGAYRQLSDATVRARLYAFLEGCRVRITTKNGAKLVPFAPNRRKVGDVADALRAVVNVPSNVRAPAWLGNDPPELDPFELIAFPNGLLHLPTRELLEPTPDFFTYTSLPFEYAATGEEPHHWLAFLHDLWPDDAESIDALQEWTGLLLTSIMRFQKILILVGPPRSGKGVWSRVVRQLVGRRNYAAMTLHSLADRFGTQTLIGKSVAVASDARISNRVDRAAIAELLLAISGEDSPAVQRKFLPDWDGRLSTRFTLLTNELPELADAAGALSSRFIVLRLTHSHLGEEDLALEARFVRELPAILGWGLDGRDRFLERGHFVQPASGLELIEQMSELGSPVSTFIEEQCEESADFEVERQELFNAWWGWCDSTGHRPGSASTFGRDLRAARPKLGDGWRRGQRVYRGLRLRPGMRVASHLDMR